MFRGRSIATAATTPAITTSSTTSAVATAERRRGISSGVTNGIPWFNSSSASPVRCHRLDVPFLATLGTSSGAPTKFRNVASTVIKHHHYTYLFDAGENTQWRMRTCYPVQMARLNRIFITHLHGDHLFGLPGVLSTALDQLYASVRDLVDGRRNDGSPMETGKWREGGDRIAVYGPQGLAKFLAGAFVTHRPAAAARMPLDVYELLAPGVTPPQHPAKGGVGVTRYIKPSSDGVYELFTETRAAPHDEHAMYATVLQHTVPCVGYMLEQKAKLHADVSPLLSRGVDPRQLTGLLRSLRNGTPVVTPDGSTVHPESVLTGGAPPLKVVILGDNSGAPAMVPLAQGADLVVHEATLPPGEEDKARARGHSTSLGAGRFAAETNAKQLLLTHFGQWFAPSYSAASIEALGRDAVVRAVSSLDARAQHRQQQLLQHASARDDDDAEAFSNSDRALSPSRATLGGLERSRDDDTASASPLSPSAAVGGVAVGMTGDCGSSSATSAAWADDAFDSSRRVDDAFDTSDFSVTGGLDNAMTAVLERARVDIDTKGRTAGWMRTSIARNVLRATQLANCTTDKRLIGVREYSYPAVSDSRLVAPVVQVAQDAMQSERVMAARDYLAVPLCWSRSPNIK